MRNRDLRFIDPIVGIARDPVPRIKRHIITHSGKVNWNRYFTRLEHQRSLAKSCQVIRDPRSDCNRSTAFGDINTGRCDAELRNLRCRLVRGPRYRKRIGKTKCFKLLRRETLVVRYQVIYPTSGHRIRSKHTILWNHNLCPIDSIISVARNSVPRIKRHIITHSRKVNWNRYFTRLEHQRGLTNPSQVIRNSGPHRHCLRGPRYIHTSRLNQKFRNLGGFLIRGARYRKGLGKTKIGKVLLGVLATLAKKVSQPAII